MTDSTKYLLEWFKAPLSLLGLLGLIVLDILLSAWAYLNDER